MNANDRNEIAELVRKITDAKLGYESLCGKYKDNRLVDAARAAYADANATARELRDYAQALFPILAFEDDGKLYVVKGLYDGKDYYCATVVNTNLSSLDICYSFKNCTPSDTDIYVKGIKPSDIEVAGVRWIDKTVNGREFVGATSGTVFTCPPKYADGEPHTLAEWKRTKDDTADRKAITASLVRTFKFALKHRLCALRKRLDDRVALAEGMSSEVVAAIIARL